MRTLLILLILSASLHADVLRVAPNGGTHTSLADALADAVDGDIILVAPPTLVIPSAQQVTVDKSVTIIGDGPERASVPIAIVEVAAGKQVVLRNLRFGPSPLSEIQGPSLWIRSSEGAVHVEDCEIHGWSDPFTTGTDGGLAASITDSSAVSITRSSIRGGFGTSTFNTPPFVVGLTGDGGQALTVTDSRVVLHDSELTGGGGGGDLIFGGPGGDGAVGLRAQNSDVWFVGCTITGGDRGLGTPNGLPAPGARLFGPDQHLRRLDTTFAGGGMAPDLVANGTLVTAWSGAAIGFTLSSPLRPGETANVRVDGPAGTLFGIFISFGPGFFPKDAFHGVMVPELATLAGPLFLANIPAGGSYSLDLTVPTLGIDGLVNVDQVISHQGADGIVLSGASAWVQVEDEP